MNATDTAADERVLEQVRHLIAKIDHPNTPDAERELCRERADRLMLRYAIDRARLEERMTDDQRETPTKVVIDLGRSYEAGMSEAKITLDRLAETNRCRAVYLTDARVVENSEDRIAHPHARMGVYGFAADVAFVEMMWTSISLAFAAAVHPRWDEQLSEGENIRRLKGAGYKWERVAEMGGFDWPDGGKMKRIYLRHLRAIGAEEERVSTQRHDAFRASFITAFYDRLQGRLRDMRDARKQEMADYERETGTVGSALVLADRSHAVDEKLYGDYPALRPLSAEEMAEVRARMDREHAERLAREQAEWDALTPKQRAARERREARERDKRNREWEREWARQSDTAGSRAGRSAADNVNLSRATGVSGATRKEIN